MTSLQGGMLVKMGQASVRRDFMFDSFVSDMQKLWVEIDLKGGWVI